MDQNNTAASNPNSRKWVWFLLVAMVLILVAVGVGAKVAYKIKTKFVTTSEYQAVFLANNQVYFGKLEMGHKWVILRDIYYLQRETTDLQPATASASNTDQSQIKLVKLGSELHGPEDIMYIASDKVMFWENLKGDSKVVQLIKQNK